MRPIPAQGGDIVSFPQKCLKNSGLAWFFNLPTSIFCKVWDFHGVKFFSRPHTISPQKVAEEGNPLIQGNLDW